MKIERKPLFWIGSSRRDLKEFPDEVQAMMGHALDIAQQQRKLPVAKRVAGFGGANVLQVVENYDGDTYRAVYTNGFAGAVYVLHAFQKKSKKGITTPKSKIDLIKSRLKKAEEHYAQWKKQQEKRDE